jgi:hypothetical protein
MKEENNNKNKEEIGDFENINFNNIEDQYSLTKKIILKEKRILTFIILFSSIFISIYFFSIEPQLVVIGMCVTAFYYIYCQNKAKATFFKNIAEKNNLQYEKNIPFSDLKGNLFKIIYSKRTRDVLIGKYKNKKTRFFHYSYTITTGKSSITFPFVVLEIFFKEISFPHTLLHYKGGGFLKQQRHGQKGKGEIKITLEEDFDKEYNLYIKDGYGIEAMQIFNKDFLRFLVEEKCNFNIELNEDRMYIYVNKNMTAKYEFKELFATANETLDRISPLLKRLKNDFAVLNKRYESL